MEPTKEKKLKEKITYLITNELRQNKFEVLSVDVFIDYLTASPTEKPIIDTYEVHLYIDYEGALDGYDPYAFTEHLKIMCNKARESVQQYVITPEGKISNNSDNTFVSDPMILDIDYKFEETHKFKLYFRIDYDEF